MLRYQIQQGHVAIPIAISKTKLKENMDVFKFDIDKSDMAALGKLDRNKQYTSLSALSYVMIWSQASLQSIRKLIFSLKF